MIVLNFKSALSFRFCFSLDSFPENYGKAVTILKRTLFASSIRYFKICIEAFVLKSFVGTKDKLVNNISILLVLVQFGEEIRVFSVILYLVC